MTFTVALALTFGTALGPITPDRTDTDALRSPPVPHPRDVPTRSIPKLRRSFAELHGVPVFAGISEPYCLATAAAVVSNRGPDWFDELAIQPAPELDTSTRRYNDAIALIRRQRRPFARTAEHIQATFGAHDTDRLVGGLL